jgi:hypothetical protein
MGAVIIAATAGVAAVAFFVYLRRERLGPSGIGLAVLRTLGVGALILLLVDPVRTERVRGTHPTVLLDASLSMGAAGGRWAEALDSARAIAGTGGVILRFGSATRAFEPVSPTDGATRLADALRAAHGRGGPTVVISDGEIEDLSALDRTLLEGVRALVLPRARVPNASLVEFEIRSRVLPQDTLRLQVGVEFTGVGSADSARIELLDGSRRLQVIAVAVTSGGHVRRTLSLAPRALGPGERVLAARVTMAGDTEPRDDERLAVVAVAAEPVVTVVAAPADWEARFFAGTVAEILRAPARAYALVRSGQWVDMWDFGLATDADVQRAVREASAVVTFGSPAFAGSARGTWRWRGADTAASVLAGDWYIVREPPPSPLASRLAGAVWDSVPPLTGLVPVVPSVGEWVGLSARLGRRGAERAVLIGQDSAGSRRLEVTGAGLWRWALRGGAPREAYRAMVASALDWLLGSGAVVRAGPLTAEPATAQGAPVVFRWNGDSIPDSTAVVLIGPDTLVETLRFDAEGRADVLLEPGVYRWAMRGGGGRAAGNGSDGSPRAGGTFVVERYSEEFRARPVTLVAENESDGAVVAWRRARERLWLFGLVLAALVGEWAWRIKRGLP